MSEFKRVKWLIEPEVFNGEMDHFIDALEETGTDHVAVQFGKSYDHYLRQLHPYDCVVFHGGFQLANLAKQAKVFPGIWCNLGEFDCLNYYPRFSRFLFNESYEMHRCHSYSILREAVTTWGGAFVRPTGADKLFAGDVVRNRDELDVLTSLWRVKGLVERNTPVIVAKARKILREWRLVICGKKVVAASQYKNEGRPDRQRGCPDEVVNYANYILSEVSFNPHPVWVMDICESQHGTFALMEVGPFSCCCLYECDPMKVIPAVNEAALAEWFSQVEMMA